MSYETAMFGFCFALNSSKEVSFRPRGPLFIVGSDFTRPNQDMAR